MTKTTTSTVALSTLTLAPANVRRVAPSAEGIEQLAANIEANGIMQNLGVYKERGKHRVFFGGRRLRALEALREAGKIEADYPVPVTIRTKAEAIELSLSENAQREAMHPADSVRAFNELRGKGQSAEDIAARFGYSVSHVRKLLALGALAPSLLDAMGEDRLSIETARALTVTDDHALQEQLFEAHGDRAWKIREALTDDKLATDSALFVYVGAEAYAEAGGTITADLFAKQGDGYADDPELVEKLAIAKLESVEQELRDLGWKQVEVSLSHPYNLYSLPTLFPAKRDLTDEEAARIEELHERIAQIEDSEPTGEELEQLHDELEQIAQARLSFPAELREQNAVYAYLDHAGTLQTRHVRLQREGTGSGEKKAKADEWPYSKALVEQLTGIRTLALQEAVASDPALALDVLLDTLTAQLVHGAYSYDLASQIGAQQSRPAVDDDLMTNSTIRRVEDSMVEHFADIPASGRFEAIRAMADDDKMQLLAALVASSLNATIPHGYSADKRIANADTYADAASLDMSRTWTPPVAFFDRMRKGKMLEVLAQECGDGAVENCKKMKGADLAVAMADRLPSDWIPQPMQSMKVSPKQDEDEGEMSRSA